MTAIPLSTRDAAHHHGLDSAAPLYAASGLSLVAALIHLWAMPAHLAEWWGYGAFFVAAALAQGLFAIALLRRPARPLFLLGIAGNLAMVALYAVTRTAGIPFFGPHAGEIHPAGTMDIACVGAELGLVAALVVVAGVGAAARRYLALGGVLALGAGAVLHLLHQGIHEAHGISPVAHWLYGSAAVVPLSVLVVWLATALSRRLAAFLYGEEAAEAALSARVLWALTGAVTYAAFGVTANGLAMHHTEAGSFLAQAGRDAGVTLGAAFLILLAFAAVRGTPWEAPRTINLWRPRTVATFAGLAAGVFLVVGPSFVGNTLGNALLPPAADAQQAPGNCNAATSQRSYDVAATNVEIPYNRWGGNNSDPHGEVFVLQGDKDAMKNWDVPLDHVRQGDGYVPGPDPADGRRLRPRPLVIRANAGECVEINLTNELDAVNGDELPQDSRVGMKVYGPAYDAQTSDGSAVGYNEDTTVGRGESISMYWKAPNAEGTFQFRDQAVMSGSEANSGSTSHGLYGAFVVEPAGSRWLDPETGDALYAGAKSHDRITKESGDPYVDAEIVPAAGKAFRETVQISQDELPGGNGFSFNYGAEPAFNRIATNPAGENEVAGKLAPDAIGEETSLSSWTYGDPSLIKLASGKGPWLPNGKRTNEEDCGLEQQPKGSCFVSNVTHAYQGDPTKVRFAHAGVKETHVFHMHAHQWRVEPEDGNSNIIDSQTYGPGESFTAELIGGAGSKPKTAGDTIFHCHLYPHFADGFWALFRVHDVFEDGTNKLPDGTNVRNLEPLPDRTAQAPQPATEAKPGYPRFMPGKYGWRAPQPPDSMSEPNGQQDNASTVEREDLDPATRVVAGRPLDQAQLGTRADDPIAQDLAQKLELEKNAMLPGANPGAPFAEPCPAGSREVTYNVSVIQTDIVYNEQGDHDTQGRIMVPTEDVDEILAGTKKPEPLFIRVNAGDCINFNLTNHLPNWFGGDAFVDIAQTNMVGGHIHLVKFDVLASDGSSNGWNYQQAAFSDAQSDFNKKVVDGEEPCDWNGCRLDDPTTWDPTMNSGQIPPGQTISERWYADTELRTVFTHDHHFAALDQNRGYFGAMIVEPEKADFRNPKTGEFYLPGSGLAAGAPQCGSECVGDAAGAAMDVIGPNRGDDFREFGIAIQDFVSLTKKGGDPRSSDPADTVNAPATPEEYPDADPGTMAINYSNAPFQYRQSKNGQPTDPAHVFSSTVHGDPKTPILEAYSEDPVRIRAIQGSQEEQHVLSVHGMRWREEPNDPNSPLVDSKAVGISEAFNFHVPKITCGAGEATCAGDYLYGGTSTDDMYLGAWGILRARGKQVNSLLPLPDNVPQAAGQQSFSRMAAGPPQAETPGTPCPTDAPSREFNVIAMAADVEYNEEGDHDPSGLMYTLVEPGETQQQAMARAKANPEPMVLRANEGDCIQVRLTNKLTEAWAAAHGNAGTGGDPTLPTEPASGTPVGTRVSLHPQLVQYDVRGSDGTAVGFNRDQTVGINDTKVYRWYADDVNPGELGTTNLTDFGDVRGHRHHGLFAGLNIEPKGSTYHDPQTGNPITSGVSADIRVPGAPDFREFTTFFQDGLNLHDEAGPIEDPLDHPPTPEEPAGVGMDAEDQGEKGFNYSNAPFSHRLPPEQMVPGEDGTPHPAPHDSRSMADVFSSKVHGDPDTPIFRTFAGDDIRMRVLQGSDKPRQHSFQVSGASWRAQPNDPSSNVIGTQGGISVGRAFNLHLSGFDSPGDYRYGCGVGFHHLSGGLWGMVRVYPNQSAKAALSPTPLRAIDNPLSLTNHPILPLEVFRVETKLSLNAKPDSVGSGQATKLAGKLVDAKGRPAANMPVVLMQMPEGSGSEFTRVATAKTNSKGAYSFANVKVNRTTDYVVRFAGNIQKGLSPSGSPVKRVVVKGA